MKVVTRMTGMTSVTWTARGAGLTRETRVAGATRVTRAARMAKGTRLTTVQMMMVDIEAEVANEADDWCDRWGS